MGNAPWYLRVSAGFVLLVGIARFVERFSSGTVTGSAIGDQGFPPGNAAVGFPLATDRARDRGDASGDPLGEGSS